MSTKTASNESTIAAKNNDKEANFVFNIMSSLVLILSTYLLYSVNDFIVETRQKNLNYEFPKYSDMWLAFAFIPLLVVCLNLNL